MRVVRHQSTRNVPHIRPASRCRGWTEPQSCFASSAWFVSFTLGVWGACGGLGGLRLVLIDNSLQTPDVLQQTLRAQAQEVVAEFWILEVDFEQPIVGDGQHLPILGAFERLRTPVVG